MIEFRIVGADITFGEAHELQEKLTSTSFANGGNKPFPSSG
jgi:hypothetical protein